MGEEGGFGLGDVGGVLFLVFLVLFVHLINDLLHRHVVEGGHLRPQLRLEGWRPKLIVFHVLRYQGIEDAGLLWSYPAAAGRRAWVYFGGRLAFFEEDAVLLDVVDVGQLLGFHVDAVLEDS